MPEPAPPDFRLYHSNALEVLAGILAEQADEVRAAYAEAFELDPTAEQDGWVRISGIRR